MVFIRSVTLWKAVSDLSRKNLFFSLIALLSVLSYFCVHSPLWPAAAADAPLPEEKLIALTFDDGPSSVSTPVLLDGLAERGVHATFSWSALWLRTKR